MWHGWEILEMHTLFWLEYLKERDNLEDLSVDRKMLEWLLRKYGERMWTECIWLRIGTSVGPCKRGNEPAVSIKGARFLD